MIYITSEKSMLVKDRNIVLTIQANKVYGLSEDSAAFAIEHGAVRVTPDGTPFKVAKKRGRPRKKKTK